MFFCKRASAYTVAFPAGFVLRQFASNSGALAYRITSDDTDSAKSRYNAEAYDVGGWHSNSSSPHLMTVPSGASYARFIVCNRRSGGTISDSLVKDASPSPLTFAGCFTDTRSDTAGGDAVSAASAIVAVSSSEAFYIVPSGTTTGSNWTDIDSWFAVEGIPSTRKMALVRKSGNQAISASTTTTMDFGAETRDTDSWHSNSSNNSRLTVPSGVSLVRVSASLYASAATSGQFVLSMQKNGGSAVGLPETDQSTTRSIAGVSAILAVSAGDYFECRAFNTDALNIQADDATWFQIEEIDAATKYALVWKSATQAISATTFTAVAFAAETADTSSFHDNSTNNSRLTIPSGVTQARLSFNVSTASTAGQFIAEVRKNGSAGVPGLPRQEADTAGTDNVNGFGAWIDVTEGDYFQLFVYSDNAQTLPIDDATWFCVECR